VYQTTEVKNYSTAAVNNAVITTPEANTLEYSHEEAHTLGMSFAQTYSLNKGIQKLGERGTEAVYSEMKQLNDRNCFRPINIEEYGPEAKRKVMESILFLTEKRDGTIKARNVTDGRKQRDWMTKEEAASPTVMLESLMLSIVIDAKEHRDVCVVDIPHAFVQTPNER
jgi:hypothetical protein